MESSWAERQRRTNKLARLLAGKVLHQPSVSSSQLLGLAKLAWITNSYEGRNASYIRRTKIPALADILDTDYAGYDLADVARDIASQLNDKSARKLVAAHTGFTNFYNSYRNSVALWVEANFSVLLPLFRQVFAANTDDARLRVVRAIEKLDGIPKANREHERMRAEYFLAPAFFILDPQIRFPIINGDKGVQDLLRAMEVSNASLQNQYLSMVRLYGVGGIRDAADLDQVRGDLTDFIPSTDGTTRKQILAEKDTAEGTDLSLKDEGDIESLQVARTNRSKRLHNQMTNQLREVLSDYTLLEGCGNEGNDAMFDVLVKNYDSGGNDLMIEVKSSSEPAHVRMAVGQLYDYWFNVKGDVEEHLAVLLPEKPATGLLGLLAWLNIGTMWLKDGCVDTEDEWLKQLKG